MSHLSRLQTKITAKTWQAAKKATNLIQNRFALLEGNMTQHDRVVFDLKGYIVKPAVLTESVAIFCAYNHINVRHHKPSTPSEVIERLAPKHQRFFKGVYHPLFDHRD